MTRTAVIALGGNAIIQKGERGDISQQFTNTRNSMIDNNALRNVVTIPSQILVDSRDPALSNPTKPIGPFYRKEEADKLIGEKGWTVKEDAGRGYRYSGKGRH